MAPMMPALGLGADGRMTIVEAPVPTPRSGQILVEVKVSAVNEMDVQVRAGGWRSQVRRFRQAGPVLTGFEFVGVARSDGARILVGQRVIGYVHVLNGCRTHAQFVCVDENDLAPIPEGLDDEAGAALVREVVVEGEPGRALDELPKASLDAGARKAPRLGRVGKVD